MAEMPLIKSVCSRASALIQVDRRDADLLKAPVEIVIQFGRAVARVRTVDESNRVRFAGLHRIVAARHVPRPTEAHTRVDALNGNKLDCRAANLVWRMPEDTNYQRSIREGAPRGVRPKAKRRGT